jgi:hypothetical protein
MVLPRCKNMQHLNLVTLPVGVIDFYDLSYFTPSILPRYGMHGTLPPHPIHALMAQLK